MSIHFAFPILFTNDSSSNIVRISQFARSTRPRSYFSDILTNVERVEAVAMDTSAVKYIDSVEWQLTGDKERTES